MLTFNEFLVEVESGNNTHPFCAFLNHCNLKETTIYGEVAICKEFVENFKKLSFELNSLLKYNLYPKKYVIDIPVDKTSRVALEFVNNYLNLLQSIIVFKKTVESFSPNDWLTPEVEADVRVFNVYIDMLNLSIKQFSMIISSGGKDCIKMNITNSDVNDIIKGVYKINPINVDHIKTTAELLQPKSDESD